MKNIFEAIDRADHGLVWQLVQSKCDLGQIDDVTGLTPLALAAELGRTETVRTLLEAGVDPDLGGVSSPLESAVAEGHIEIVRMLIDGGADVHQKVGEGFAPLMSAAFLGDVEIVRLLLEKGAQPRARNFDGETAIDLAAAAGFEELSQEIRDFSHKEFEQERHRQEEERRRREEEELQRRREERRARIEAARAGRSGSSRPFADQATPSPFSRLREGSFSPRPRTGDRRAARRPHEDAGAGDPAAAFEALFGAPDATPAPIDPMQLEGIDRFAALLITAPVRARRMIDFGELSGEERSAAGETPLMLAAAAGEAEVVKVLLAKGVEVDLEDTSENRETALLKAVQTPSRGRHEVLELLIDAGADLERRHGEAGRTPLMFAAQSDVYSPDPFARAFGDTTRHLIKLGANLEAEDGRGDTLWKIIKRAAIGAPTSSPFRRRLFDMQKVIEKAGGVSSSGG